MCESLIRDNITKLIFCESHNLEIAYDCALVLGNDWVNTMDHVYRHYKEGKFKWIIISGHSPKMDKEPEAIRFFNYGLSIGIPSEVMILEQSSSNTKENIVNCKKLICNTQRLKEGSSVLIYCFNFHAGRVKMTCNANLREIDKVDIFGVMDDRNISERNWWKNETGSKRVMQEVERIGKYYCKGDIGF